MALPLMIDISYGLAELHDLGIDYCDLTPGNVRTAVLSCASQPLNQPMLPVIYVHGSLIAALTRMLLGHRALLRRERLLHVTIASTP